MSFFHHNQLQVVDNGLSSPHHSDEGSVEVSPSYFDQVSHSQALYSMPWGCLHKTRQILCLSLLVLLWGWAWPDDDSRGCVCVRACVCRRECWELSLVLKKELINKRGNTLCLERTHIRARGEMGPVFVVLFACSQCSVRFSGWLQRMMNTWEGLHLC